MSKTSLDINNEDKNYLDEKELFILYLLFKNKHISSCNNVFTPNNTNEIHITNTGNAEENIKNLEQQVNNNLEKTRSKERSPIIMSYLLELGKELDEKDFSIYCNADYSLVEGGFLIEDMQEIMIDYFEDAFFNRSDKKYKALNKIQKDFLDESLKQQNLDVLKLTALTNLPVKEYQEAILNKKADKDFIFLVNKLIINTDKYKNSKWDKNDIIEFIEIYYRHNKEMVKKSIDEKIHPFLEDNQTKLAKLIFENIDIHLFIKDTKKIEQYLLEYINLFRGDKLNDFSKYGLTRKFFSVNSLTIPLYTKFFGFKKQKDILLKHTENTFEKYKRNDLEIGSPYVKPEYIGDDRNDEVKFTLSETDEEKELFLFVHTMIALEYEKYLEIESFSYGTTDMFDLYDRGFVFNIKLKNNKRYISEQKLTKGESRKSIFLENDFLCFGDKKIPMERGQKSMVGLFLDNAKIFQGDKLSKKGSDVSITKLVEAGGYTDDNAFRDGLKRLRAKIKKADIPATIENTGTGKYQLVIKYQ